MDILRYNNNSNLSKSFKETLSTLKQRRDDRNASEIRYISKLIRCKYAKKHLNIEYCNNDDKIAKKKLGLL